MKKTGRKKCIECGHPVGGGGNRHAKDHCPRKPGIYGGSRMEKMLKRREEKKQAKKIKRGVPVAGTGAGAAEQEEKQ